MIAPEAAEPFDFRMLAGPVGCVDVGGTKVAVLVADTRGVRSRAVEATVKEGSRDALARQVVRMLEHCCREAGYAARDLAAVGVASCGPFVARDGAIELAAPNICGGAAPARTIPNDWRTVPLESPLRNVFAAVRVENDGTAALEAERRWGALRDGGRALADCAYVTWSTGVGVGLCVDGRVLRGKNGNAGHAGHMFVSDDAHALCGCGNTGDVEALVAGNALARGLAPAGFADAAALFAAAYAGDRRAGSLVDTLCRIMGRMLYNLVATLDLQRISLGGSVFWHNREYLLPRLQAQVGSALTPLTRGCDLVAAGLGPRVGDFGALALVA